MAKKKKSRTLCENLNTDQETWSVRFPHDKKNVLTL